MSKTVYVLLMVDQAMNQTTCLGAFEGHPDVVKFQDQYIIENYGTSFDMRAEGVELQIEPVPYKEWETDRMV